VYAELEQFSVPVASDYFYAGIGSAGLHSENLLTAQELMLFYEAGVIDIWQAGVYRRETYPFGWAVDGVLQILVSFADGTVQFGVGGVFGTPLAIPTGALVLTAASSSSSGNPMNARMRTTAARFVNAMPVGAVAWDDASVEVV
jgi:hypothetical protein